jgi:DNA-directed RNA polymerase specialized sigma24 family protein
VIVLTVLDDRPDAEVADLLGISEITVRTTRSRALARLRARLTAEERTGTAEVADITSVRRAPLRVPA